ncbi:MAG: OmpA family protein [Bacteroidetes bacterium]|nr:MAG: OmpA family protein [Bacteroidota bacterium]
MQKTTFRTLLLLLFAGFWVCSAFSQSVFDSTRIAVRTEVYFPFGAHTLDQEAQHALDSFFNQWGDLQPPMKIRITAHTDSVGSLTNNLALSERRANAVKTALLRRGVPASQLGITFWGERKPAAPNATEAGRQQNRRATLEAYFHVPMVPYSGQVKDKTTGAGIPATVHFSTRTRRDSVETDTIGRYLVQLPRDSVVKIEAYAKDHFFKSVMQRIYGTPEMLQRMREQPMELTLAPATTGEKAAINNLFFVGNQAVLLKSSEPELPKVLRFMRVNPEIEVEIAGHINHPGVAPEALERWEWNLSVNRAKLVYDFLIKNGISAERLSYKGYGNTEMLFPNRGASEAEQEQNRRVEIRVK